jgi:hypothetical protein
MKLCLLPLVALALSATACGRAALDAPANAPVADSPVAAPAKAASEDPTESPVAAANIVSAPAKATRNVGDFVTYRFSGAFRKAPVAITEKVVARKGGLLLVDVVMDDGKKKEELLVKMTDDSEVRAVSRLVNGVETATDAAAFERMFAKATLAADANEATLGTQAISVDVGGKPLAAQQTTFRVRVGKKTATMKTLESASFAWGDLGGEITTEDGKTLYKAEVVEVGTTAPGDLAKLAHFDDE